MTPVQCAGIILINPDQKVLLQLRDNKPAIPYPNCWVIPGGSIEPGESSKETLLREMREEMNYELVDPLIFFDHRSFSDSAIGYIQECDYYMTCVPQRDASQFSINEGQRLSFFGEDDLSSVQCGFDTREVVLHFFEWMPQHDFSSNHSK